MQKHQLELKDFIANVLYEIQEGVNIANSQPNQKIFKNPKEVIFEMQVPPVLSKPEREDNKVDLRPRIIINEDNERATQKIIFAVPFDQSTD